MRILQILTPGASEYDRKAIRLDSRLQTPGTTLQAIHLDQETEAVPGDFDLVHVYGPPLPAAALIRRLGRPWVGSAPAAASLLPWRRIPSPAASTSPLAGLPEAVDPSYLAFAPRRFPLTAGRYVMGSCLPKRDKVEEIAHTTMRRLSAFRDDVEWLLFDETPTSAEMAGVDLWIDPTTDPSDLDGATAEAMALGIMTIAARTPIAALRSGHGSGGILVRPGDPNELTHAIARALFRPETTEELRSTARDLAAGFDPATRGARLESLYREVAA